MPWPMAAAGRAIASTPAMSTRSTFLR